MEKLYLSLGSNIGNRKSNLENAKFLIEQSIGQIQSQSSVYETEAWGFSAENLFLNQVIEVETDHWAEEILKIIKNIERKAGRSANSQVTGYSSRIIDIDILFLGNQVVELPHLTIPHKNIPNRLFELIPLCELDETIIHPLLNTPVKTLLKNCTDQSRVIKMDYCPD